MWQSPMEGHPDVVETGSIRLAEAQGVAPEDTNHILPPEGPADETSPFAYPGLDGTSGCTEAIWDTPQPMLVNFFACNLVRLIPVPHPANRSLLRMEIDFHEPNQEFFVFRLDGSEQAASMTMGEVLRLHARSIVSIVFDATMFPNPVVPNTMVGQLILPFAPRAVTSEVHLHSAASGALPFFPALEDITISTSRAVSVASLLDFLHFCPMVKKLAIHNTMRHKCVLPESVDDAAEPSLPHLAEVIVDGLLSHTTEHLLNKLSPSLNEHTRVQVHLHGIGFPVLQHGPALRKLFAGSQHVRLSYTHFTPVEGGPTSPDHPTQPEGTQPSCLFTCSDAAARVQLNWHWKSVPDSPPNLMHIGLANPAFARVRTLSLSLQNVRPAYYDLASVLAPFHRVDRIEVHTFLPTPPGTLSPEPDLALYSKDDLDPDTASITALLSGPERAAATGDDEHDVHSDKPAPERSLFLVQHRVFTICSPSVVRALARVPTLLAIELTQLLHNPAHGAPRPSLRRLTKARKPEPWVPDERVEDDAHLPKHVRELAAIVSPPLLFAMEIAQGPVPGPPASQRAARVQAKVAARMQLPAHLRRLARCVYDPLWALMVRDRTAEGL